MSEPAIQVRRKSKGTQVWTIEKLENKLVDMRDQYREWKEGRQDTVRDTNKYVESSMTLVQLLLVRFYNNGSFPRIQVSNH